MSYTLINPFVTNKQFKSNKKNENSAAEDLWSQLSSNIKNHTPEFYFSFKNNKNNKFFHYKVNENLENDRVKYSIKKLKNKKVNEKLLTNTIKQEGGFSDDESDLDHKDQDDSELNNDDSELDNNQTGGKHKKHRKLSRSSRYSKYDSSSSSSSSSSEKLLFTRSGSDKNPLFIYNPLVYPTSSLYFPLLTSSLANSSTKLIFGLGSVGAYGSYAIISSP